MNSRNDIIPFVWKLIALATVVVAAYFLRNIVMLVFIAFIFASALYPAVRLGKKVYIPSAISILFLYLLLFAFISFCLSFIIPPLAEQTMQLVNTTSTLLGVQKLSFDSFGTVDLQAVASSFDQYGSIVSQFQGSLQVAMKAIFSTFSFLFIFFTWLVMSSHMLMEMDELALAFAWLLPEEGKKGRAERAKLLLDRITSQMGSWVRGQLFLMLVIGVGTYIGLYLLGIPYALPLAILAGLLEIVPNLGPTLASIPAIAAGLFLVSPLTGLFTMLFYLILQQVENNFLVPMIMREAIDVRPLTTIILMLVGYQTMGVTGAIVVLPAYITVRLLIQELSPHSGPFSDYRRYEDVQ